LIRIHNPPADSRLSPFVVVGIRSHLLFVFAAPSDDNNEFFSLRFCQFAKYRPTRLSSFHNQQQATNQQL
jgi:hypothetical protein